MRHVNYSSIITKQLYRQLDDEKSLNGGCAVLTDAHQTFVANLERRRLDAGMTKRALVQRSGLSSTFVFEILRHQGSPSLRSLEMLANAVNATLPELFAPTDECGLEKRQKRRVAPEGLELVTVVLPPEKAFLVRRWEADAIKTRRKP